MHRKTLIAVLLLTFTSLIANEYASARELNTGNFSLGTRNTISSFNYDAAIGIGIGGQARFQFSDKLNSEWYADYIPSETKIARREDYHIGWSLMFYPGNYVQFDRLLQPYLIAGHCFDYSIVSQHGQRSNSADRFSSATQAGIGTHFNITKRFDCSVSAQYMLHFGKEIEIEKGIGDAMDIHRSESVKPDGHLLITVSFNYKFVNFWNGWKSI